jgi:hypothetical protein
MVTLFSHIGLGDLILLSGAIVTLAQEFGSVRIFCYAHHETSVRSFFVGYPGVYVVPVPRGTHSYGIPPESELVRSVDGPILRTGFYADPQVHSDISFPVVFYRQLGIPYTVRWLVSPLEKAAELIPQLKIECEVFVHDDPARGFLINQGIEDKAIYRPVERGGSILGFVSLLRQMEEIHCIDSCFYHLIESIGGITAKLYYHRYARLYIPGWFDYPKLHHWLLLI